ncbi:MAG: DNA-binding transcriptional regulator OxyR [Crocinitomicaceae bacterium]|nr:DNA-binding transcriptional regulator OxyR [Crocinitomicaceae bacterium]|tara:strand:- start:2755 stop:3705 length:951 start_codon:yes stop_codon:yes gene_type:complete
MTLVQLEYIVAIADYGSFVEAASKCFVTQPALTTQVKNLENELDVVIFDRTRKPIIPTEIGAQIIEQAREVIQQSRKIPDIVSEFNTEVKGNLTLGIIPTISPYLIPLFINHFNKQHPKVNVSVREEITEEVIFKLKNGELDAGIIATPIETKGVITIPLYYEKFYVYVSRNHPLYYKEELAATDLKVSDLWLLKDGNCFRNQVINICAKSSQDDFANQFRYESHSIESLKRIVEVKDGITLIPELAAKLISAKKDDMIKVIKDVQPVREVSLVVSRQFLKKRLIDNLANLIKERVPEDMLQKPDEGTIIETDIKV